MKAVYWLLTAQFLSALADNAILFTAVAMILDRGMSDGWYLPAMQGAFLVAFVVLAPWVGRFADTRSKPRVLMLGNALKLVGAALMLCGVDSLAAYAVVGIGAAIYSPAKYGILPELVDTKLLVKANGMMEGATVLAIVLGPILGAMVADHSIDAALILVMASFLLSIVFTTLLPRLPACSRNTGPIMRPFFADMRRFLSTTRARFSMLGASLFWAAAAVLRVAIVAWAPLVLGYQQSSDIAGLSLFLAIGIIVGAGVAPRLIRIENLRAARLAGYAMGACIVVLAGATEAGMSKALLFATGVAGGLFVVPINAALQELGHRSIGAGGAVAIQNLFENVGMLVAVGVYSLSAGLGAAPQPSILVLGLAVMIATLAVSWRLPRQSIPSEEALQPAETSSVKEY